MDYRQQVRFVTVMLILLAVSVVVLLASLGAG